MYFMFEINITSYFNDNEKVIIYLVIIDHCNS
jgi:hypothetical protein